MTSSHTQKSTAQTSTKQEYKPLEEYGIIGNGETVALVGRDGAIDWCCFPHVESPSLFARLLDSHRGGHFTVRPGQEFEAAQKYIEETNVLRTRFEAPSGEATVTDFMPVPEAKRTEKGYQQAIYRKISGVKGRVDLHIEFEPRFDYARNQPTFESTRHGVVATGDTGDERAFLSTELSLQASEDSATGSVTVDEGETCWLVLGYQQELPTGAANHQQVLEEVIEYWREWMHGGLETTNCSIQGPWHDLAVRSELLLKLLIHRDTGAVCAAPTTSLPEEIGGVRNWDYRYNWIRDSTFTVQAFAELGHLEEATDYFEMCLSHCSQGTPAEIQPVYGLHGQTDLEEKTLNHLAGYRESTPVRIGNDAASQQQLDVYGELVVGVYKATQYGATLSQDSWKFIHDVVEYVCEVWQDKDVGIWEIRDDPQHFVYSKVMCWATIDRGIKFVKETDYEGPVDKWRKTREAIHREVLQRGYNEELGSFVQSYGHDEQLDAATLRIPLVDFLPADDPRVQGTIDTIQDRLMTDDGLVTRIEGDDGLPGEEGAFTVCSFWMVNALALADRVEEATSLFEAICEFASPLGLLAEEIDRETGRQLGNYPQGFSHIGLLTSAIMLTEWDAATDADMEAMVDAPGADSERATTTYPGYTKQDNSQ